MTKKAIILTLFLMASAQAEAKWEEDQESVGTFHNLDYRAPMTQLDVSSTRFRRNVDPYSEDGPFVPGLQVTLVFRNDLYREIFYWEIYNHYSQDRKVQIQSLPMTLSIYLLQDRFNDDFFPLVKIIAKSGNLNNSEQVQIAEAARKLGEQEKAVVPVSQNPPARKQNFGPK